MNDHIKEILEKQLELLSKYSEKCRGIEEEPLSRVSESMVEISKVLLENFSD